MTPGYGNGTVRSDSLIECRERGVGNGPVAGRFVLLFAGYEDGMDHPEWGYVTSWDTWEQAEAAFPIAAGYKLRDDETGREWFRGYRYEWEAAQT